MLNIHQIATEERKTAEAVAGVLDRDFRGTAYLWHVRVPKSTLLEEIARLEPGMQVVERSWFGFGRKTVLSGVPTYTREVLKAYMATVLGSDGIA